MFYSFFLLVPLSHQNLQLLLLDGNRSDWIETLTPCGEWSQLGVDYYIRQSDLFTIHWGFTSSSISHNDHQYTTAASTCCQHRPIYSSVAANHDVRMSQPIPLQQLCRGWCIVFLEWEFSATLAWRKLRGNFPATCCIISSADKRQLII